MVFLQRKGNRVAQAAINFDDFLECGPCQFVGFTICDDPEKGLFVLFPSAQINKEEDDKKLYFFLRPGDNKEFLQKLEDKILDVYESMTAPKFNRPRIAAGRRQTDALTAPVIN